MPVFKVFYKNEKKMCKGTSVLEILNFAKAKWKLPADSPLKIVLEEDGTDIDDDDVLITFAEESKTTIILRVLEENCNWKDNAENNDLLMNAPSTSKKASIADDVQINEENSFNLNEGLWKRVPDFLHDKCKSGEKLVQADRRKIASTLADYMLNDLKITKRGLAEKIAKKLCLDFPNSFQDGIGNVKWSNGVDNLTTQIYNAVCYRKPTEEKNKKRKIQAVNDSDDDDIEEREKEIESIQRQDEYGCVNFAPKLPDTETPESQEEKRQRLIALCETNLLNVDEICSLMSACYPTIRATLNAKSRQLSNIFIEWPFLKHPDELINHCSKLLDKDIKKIWDTALVTKGKYIRRYFKLPKVRENYEQFFQESKEAMNVTKDVKPKTLILFHLLTKYFNENEQQLFKIVDELNFADPLSYADSEYPILIIKGKSLYDEEAKHYVVLSKKISIECYDALNGLLILFASYYVFGYVYCPQVEKTLEFMQRILFKINPPHGSKRSSSKRRRKIYDSAVLKFAKQLSQFSDEFNID